MKIFLLYLRWTAFSFFIFYLGTIFTKALPGGSTIQYTGEGVFELCALGVGFSLMALTSVLLLKGLIQEVRTHD